MVQSFSRFSINGDIIKYEYHIFQKRNTKKGSISYRWTNVELSAWALEIS